MIVLAGSTALAQVWTYNWKMMTSSSIMIIARTLKDLAAARASLGPIGFVPTMGALHEGHLALLNAAKTANLTRAASIFVNPTQFGPKEDLSRYPRDEAGDIAKLKAAGCALLWLPDVTTMYPADDSTMIQIGQPSLNWEGKQRPGHFNGVATVVAKLFGQMRPEFAFFGEKDWQQAQVIRRLVTDLHLNVEICTVPTVREADGLALSSRNRYLSAAERQIAPLFHATLTQTVKRLNAGEIPANALQKAEQELATASIEPDYVALVHAHTLEPIDQAVAPARLIAAARLGPVRLLDNLPVC